MKKILILILLVFVFFTLVGCNNYNKDEVDFSPNPHIEVPLGKYSGFMSSSPGLPIEFNFASGEIGKYIMEINIDDGKIINWNRDTGITTDLGNSYNLKENKTLYFIPEKDTIITVKGIKNAEELFVKTIKITFENEYFYATLE